MIVYLHHVELGYTAKVAVQGGEDDLYLTPSDLPDWANPVSANAALVNYLVDGEREYRYGAVTYIVHDERASTFPALRLVG